MADSDDFTLVLAYSCVHCGAELEAGLNSWSAWRLCPVCNTPSPMPTPAWNASATTAGTFGEATDLYNPAPPGPSLSPQALSSIQDRYGWLDAVVPPAGKTVRAVPPYPNQPLDRSPSSPANADEDVSWVEPIDEMTVRPLPIAASHSIPPELQKAMSALSRPAHVPGMSESPYSSSRQPTRASGGRVFLGLALCVTTVGGLFQLLDGENLQAAIFGAGALISLVMLARPGQRRPR